MALQDIFNKDIDRRIEGVIKADDDSDLASELSEYVLTNEAADRLEGLLEDYNAEASNGAWISGYFGSGKSHLLKMMALVLENREIDGARAADLFLPKCADRPELKALLARAVAIPSKSILFNIDQKATAIAVGAKDTILEVFLRVFNESCGYSSALHIAQMERELDVDGQFDAFRAAFLELSGKDWEHGRTRDRRYSGQIDEAYRRATGSNKTNVLEDYRKTFSLSIEGFAKIVKEYIERQEAARPGFRLNFFVDEVGQFVASKLDRMLNLQTVAESLNTICKRKSWLVVTSQTDLSALVGGMTRQGGNDFSKIEARFSTKLPLTGANADEVIQRRLLEKKPSVAPDIDALYARHAGDLPTMFDFADGSKRYKTYEDGAEFAGSYPFVPYQFDLFRTTMINLSDKDAFAGKFTAIGERSMLAVCQDALKALCHDTARALGSAVPFDFWFEGIRLSLKSSQINQVIVAEHHLADPLAIRLLKALYLVKYVREFRATARNLAILLIDDLDANVADLLRRVEASLAELERQSYVQHVGNVYEYLTDEEKDIDKEIRAIDVLSTEIEDLYNDIFFNTLLTSRRMRLADGTDVPYRSVIDEHARGAAGADLAIHFVTPEHPASGDLPALKLLSFGKDEMLVAIPQDPQLVQDIRLYKQTDRYLRQNSAHSQPEGTRRNLLLARGQTNEALRTRIDSELVRLVGQATVFVSGDEARTTSTEPKTRLAAAFQELADRVYSSRPIIAPLVSKTEGDVPAFLRRQANQPALPGMPAGAALSEAETEILNFVRANAASGKLTTAQAVVDHFVAKPYGWPQAPVLCLLARLWAGGHVACTSGGAEQNEAALRAALVNSRARPGLVVALVQTISPAQLRQAKDFAQAFFDEPVAGSDPKAVGEEIAGLFRKKAEQLDSIARRRSEYPFLAALDDPLAKCRDAAAKPWSWFFGADFSALRDPLLDAKQDDLDPIVRMFANRQNDLYSEARRFYGAEKANFPYWGGDPSSYNAAGTDEEKLGSLLADPAVYKGGRLQTVRTLLTNLQARGQQARAEIYARSKGEAQAAVDALAASPVYAAAPPAAQAAVDAAAKTALDALDTDPALSAIILRAKTIVSEQVPGWMNQLAAATAAAAAAAAGKPAASAKPVRVVQLSATLPPVPGSVLETTAAADAWLDALRKKLHEEIESGARIYVSR